MGCRSSRDVSYATCVRAVARRIVAAPAVDKNDAARLLVFFDAPANVVARATLSNAVATHEHEWKGVATRLLSCPDSHQSRVMAPMLSPIYNIAACW